ncbi:TPM domain-containing protein [Pseudomonas sp. GG8]
MLPAMIIVRIEVSDGLEERLDHAQFVIINQTTTPAFKAGTFSGGISQAVQAMIQVPEESLAEPAADNGRDAMQNMVVPGRCSILYRDEHAPGQRTGGGGGFMGRMAVWLWEVTLLVAAASVAVVAASAAGALSVLG